MKTRDLHARAEFLSRQLDTTFVSLPSGFACRLAFLRLAFGDALSGQTKKEGDKYQIEWGGTSYPHKAPCWGTCSYAFAAIAARQQRQPHTQESKVNRFVKALGENNGDVTVALATEKAMEFFTPIDESNYAGYGGSLGREGYDESVLAQYAVFGSSMIPTDRADACGDFVEKHEYLIRVSRVIQESVGWLVWLVVSGPARDARRG
jgi:hypothetical protein